MNGIASLAMAALYATAAVLLWMRGHTYRGASVLFGGFAFAFLGVAVVGSTLIHQLL